MGCKKHWRNNPLKSRGSSAILPAMAAVRLAAVLPFVLAVALTAQNTSTSQVDVTVVDPTGAAIHGAHIGIIHLPTVYIGDWLQYAHATPEETSVQTDLNGEATVGLAKGSYAIVVAANGFQPYAERLEVVDQASQSLRATLAGEYFGSGSPVVTREPEIPLEPTPLDVFVPLEPLQSVTFARRFRRRWMH